MRRLLITASLISVLLSCQKNKMEVPASYYPSIKAWQEHRNAGLRSPDSWLTLAGLFWLPPGDSTIGTGPTNTFVLPQGAGPAVIGRLHLSGDSVIFTNLAGAAVTANGKPLSHPMALRYDETSPDVVRAGTLSFFIIKRLDRLGVRAKDTASPVLKNFTGMSYFPIAPQFDFRDAKLIPDSKKMPILNVLGQTEMQESPGVVEFSYRGKTYRLRPIYEGKTLFFLFKDPTNQSATYQAGRMLNTPLPVNGTIDLDFNKSYNPPCTFTPYATCPLPPRENDLPFPVEAGEKRYRHGHPA